MVSSTEREVGAVAEGEREMMKQYSKRIFTLKLPKNYAVHVDLEEDGRIQQSTSFSLRTLFSVPGLSFANRFNDAIKYHEQLPKKKDAV